MAVGQNNSVASVFQASLGFVFLYGNWTADSINRERKALTTHKELGADGQDTVAEEAGGMSTHSGHGRLEVAGGEPGAEPLHVAVTQQAAGVQDAGKHRKETGGGVRRVIHK